uniref:Pectinesterase inhibitor domain-containing protein n=1 Tax=Oryza barthii TaxID=65489 RepID=A0A0D3FUY0_9ORYZ
MYVGRICGPGSSHGVAGPVRDCLENIADSLGHLCDAAQELGGNMGRAGSPGFKWHLSNVQTWCSAALTDKNTCLDGLSRGVDAATRGCIVVVHRPRLRPCQPLRRLFAVAAIIFVHRPRRARP